MDKAVLCRTCRKDTGFELWKLCAGCAALSGECQEKDCSRKIGPATRGVELELSLHPPGAEITWRSRQAQEDAAAGRVRIAAGAAPRPWLAAKLAENVKAVPEIQSEGGRQLTSCCVASWVLMVRDAQGAERCNAQPLVARPHDKSLQVLPLSESASQRCPDFGPEAGAAFAKPGTYTVRAAAGRLVSNPVTVVVEGEVKPAPEPAAGWQREGMFFRCPVCSRIPVNLDPDQKCTACGKRFIGGGPAFKLCKDCAAAKGQCQMCPSTTVPARPAEVF
jgi:hypothetical protein